MAKKFTKFYLNQFKPITKLEENDVTRARNTYRGFTMIGALTCGFLSFKYRRMKISMLEPHEASRDQNFIMSVFNDAISVLLGYVGAHLLACDYIYKRRTYILERLY